MPHVRHHTFQYLNVPLLDNLFSKLDDKTTAGIIDNKKLQVLARVGYHLTRALAIGLQIILALPLAGLWQIGRLASYAGALGGRVALMAARTPMAARRRFFPAQAELIDQRVGNLDQAFKEKKRPTAKSLVMEGGKELPHDAKKELLNSWMDAHLKRDAASSPASAALKKTDSEALQRKNLSALYQLAEELAIPNSGPNCLDETPRDETKARIEALACESGTGMFRFLMNELADGDVSEDISHTMKLAVKELSQTRVLKEQVRYLPSLVSSFIDIFRDEKKQEDALKIPTTAADLGKLLEHPNALKNPGVAAAVQALPPTPLREKVIQKMNDVQQRALAKIHAEEQKILADLPTMLRQLSFREISDKYSDDGERAYLGKRIQEVSNQIADMAAARGAKDQTEKGFDERVLELELSHLETQKISMQNNYDRLEEFRANSEAIISQGNDVRNSNLEEVQALFLRRTAALSELDRKLPAAALSVWQQEGVKLLAEFNKLKKLPAEARDDEKHLKEIATFTGALQKLEKQLLTQVSDKSGYLEQIKAALTELEVKKTHLDAVHRTSPPWSNLAEMKTHLERDKERKEAFAKDVICLSLEKNSECQLPLLLAGKDARFNPATVDKNKRVSELEAKLKEWGIRFVQAVQEKHLRTFVAKLESLGEFVGDTKKGGDFPILAGAESDSDKEAKRGLNFETFARRLDVSEALHNWHLELQKIWVEHISREDEEAILAISNKTLRQKKMKECFTAWMLAKTSAKLAPQIMDLLSFEGIQIRDLSAERTAAIGQIHRHNQALQNRVGADGNLDPRIGIKRPEPRAEVPASAPSSKGFASSLIERGLINFAVEAVVAPADLYEVVAGAVLDLTNPVRALQEARRRIVDPAVLMTNAVRCQWIKELHTNPQLQGLRDLRLTIIAECKELAEASLLAGEGVPLDIQIIFVSQYRNLDNPRKPLDLSKINNFERKNFLTTFVQMTFAGRDGDVVNVTEAERYYLVQFCALSNLTAAQAKAMVDRALVNPAAPTFFVDQLLFNEVGRELQAHDIGLEGLEESALQKSFQTSTLPRTSDTRTWLDYWRGRSGEALLKDLFDYTVNGRDDDRAQGREEISRAIFHAFKGDPVGGRAYVQGLLAAHPAPGGGGGVAAVDPSSLAPPVRMFFLDLLCRHFPEDPIDPAVAAEIQPFNEALILSNDVNQMLMGFSREVTRLSGLLAAGAAGGAPISDEDFARLIKYKVAYQSIKLDHFHEKREIGGFLKTEVDAAEEAMVSTASGMQEKLVTLGYLQDTLRPLLLAKLFPARPIETYADRILKDAFKDKDAQLLVADPDVPGFFSLGIKIQIDGVLGVLYYDGRQKVSLPAHLQNHPDMRSLQIHTLPYIQDVAGGPFHYLTEEGGKKIPQVTVTEKGGQPIIHKRLPTQFALEGLKPKLHVLQFISKEKVSLPYAVAHRMEVKNFWQDEAGDVYGYDGKGDLAVALRRPEPTDAKGQWQVEVKDPLTKKVAIYYFVSQADVDANKADEKEAHPALSRLLQAFNPNDILLNWKDESFWIPSVGLKFTKQGEGKEAVWKCEGKGIGGMILDPSAEAASYVTLKNETGSQKVYKLRKELILAKKHLGQVEAHDRLHHLSMMEKQEIFDLKREVSHLESAIDEAEGRVNLMTFPEAGFERATDLVLDKVEDLIPPGLAVEWKRLPVVASGTGFSFEVYKETLQFLPAKLQECYQESLAVGLLPADLEDIQVRYLEIEKAYREVQTIGEKSCDRPADSALFSRFTDESLSSRDLSGSLSLAADGAKHRDEETVPPLKLIRELARYPIVQPLAEFQFTLLKRAQERAQKTIDDLRDPLSGIAPPADLPNLERDLKQLLAYLSLLEFQQLSYQMEWLAHQPLSDKAGKVAEIEAAFAETAPRCETVVTSLPAPVFPEVIALWRRMASIAPAALDAAEPKLFSEDSDKRVGKSVVTGELVNLCRETLLERLFATESINAVAKDADKELSTQQRSLIGSFQIHSPDQVAGFFLEELGRFNLDGLYGEFRIAQQPDGEDQGLFGLQRNDVNKLFNFLVKEGKCALKGSESYYSLTSADEAMTLFQKDQVRALLTDRPLSEEQMERIAERLQAFLFKAMQSSFKYSFKSVKAETELNAKLEKEKEKHLQKCLDAEAFLKRKLDPAGILMVDLKYAVFSGDYRKFKGLEPTDLPALRNALTRYLFHKTEVQHIENIAKAPALGERNKIELLQTRRNYSVDFLLQEGLKGAEREEQIIQRAFLVFEEDYGYRCNAMQIKMFHSLLLSNDLEAIDAAQARMGFGKTALLPLMAIVRVALEREYEEADRHLVRYVVPRAVIEDNTSSFNQRLSNVLGSNVVKDWEFSRYQIDKDDPEHSYELIIRDLNARLAFYKDAQKRGDVLIQWPEIRGSMEAQDLEFGEKLIKDNLADAQKVLCMQAKRLLGQVRSIATYTVFDELDDTQDIKSREVNYTRGDKTAIPKSTIRPLEKLISFIEKEGTAIDWRNLKEAATRMLQEVMMPVDQQARGTPPIAITSELLEYLTDRNIEIGPDVHPFLSTGLVNYLEGVAGGTSVHTEQDSMLFLIRGLLLDSNILALAQSKQPSTHFGARFVERDGERVYFQDPDSGAPLLIAVPYEGTNTPKGLSIFDNTEVAAITTIRYYLSQETLLNIKPHLDFLITQARKDAIPPDLAAHYLVDDAGAPLNNPEGRTPLEQLKEISVLLDAEELKQAKEKFYNDFVRVPTKGFRKFFGMAVVSTQIRSDAACAKSDRYEKGSPKNIEKGCSGTVGGTSSYFVKQETDAAADGKLSLEIMGRANNSAIVTLTPPDPAKGYLQEILGTILEVANANTRAVIDAAGMCKSRDGTPESVVAELWTQIQAHSTIIGVEGIVYYGKDGVKRLYRGPEHLPIPCTTKMELDAMGKNMDGKKYFSFYGQKNTRGSDIKQANGAHALVTMDENVLNSDAKQAVLRFRNLVNRDSQQTFSFALMPMFETILKQRLKAGATEGAAKVQNEIVTLIEANDLPLAADRKGREAFRAKLRVSRNPDDVAKLQALNECVALEVQVGKLTNLAARIAATPVEAKEVANFLRFREKDLEEKGALTIFRKEMAAHVKQAAAHLEQGILAQIPDEVLTPAQADAYKTFLTKRAVITGFVETSIATLSGKYGAATMDKERDEFIQEQRDKAAVSLGELFVAAEEFAASPKVNVDMGLEEFGVTREFYDDHIERSVSFFKKRYGEDTPVQTSTVNAEAMAVAEALAEALALAEAEAEGLAEKLAESEVEVEDRVVPPLLVMTHHHHDPVSLDFVDDANAHLRSDITDYPPMKNLIRPDLRARFKVSPYLMANPPMACQFVLVKDGFDRIFVSQEEAEAFKVRYAAGAYLNGYALHDARKVAKGDRQPLAGGPAGWNLNLAAPEIQQIPCAILGANGLPAGRVPTTAVLRTTMLTNVASAQLLPYLDVDVTTGNIPTFAAYVNLDAFGLNKPAQVDLSIVPPPAPAFGAPPGDLEIVIGCGGVDGRVTIPKGNRWLDQFIPQAYATAGPGKITQVQALIAAEFAKHAGKLAALEGKKVLLAVQETQQQTLLSNPNIGKFERNASMDAGFANRISQFVGASGSDKPQYMKNYGVLFTEALEAVGAARADFNATKSVGALRHLSDAFDQFVLPQTIQRGRDLGLGAKLVNDAEWGAIIAQKKTYANAADVATGPLRPLELVYGRILYAIHLADVTNAAGCGQPDCACMFKETLPQLIAAVGVLKGAIVQVEAIEAQKAAIQAEIDAIMLLIAGLPEAKEAMDKAADAQYAIEQNLQANGIQLSRDNELFDRFNLAGFDGWNAPVTATIGGVLPDYAHVVREDMAKDHPEAIFAHTQDEAAVRAGNQSFLQNVINLARNLESRPAEIAVH